MKKVLLILITFTFYQGTAQTLQDRELPLRFGLAPTIYLPQYADQFDNKMSLSPAAFVSYRLPKVSLLGRLGYRALNYTNLDTRSEVRAHELISQLGAKLHHPGLQSTNIVLAYTPSFIMAAEQLTVGKSVSLNPVKNFRKEYTRVLHHGIYAGVELDLSSRNSLEIGYTYSFNRKSSDLFVDGSPSTISLGYNINFNLKPKLDDAKSLMNKNLRKLSSEGTLYIINRTCEDDFTNIELDSLWNTNYTASKYKVINDEDIPEIMKSKGFFFFAVMGKYYAGLGEPTTTGIYMLDRTATLLQWPYPYYTAINNGTSNCIGLKEIAAIGIRKFSTSIRAY